MEEIDSLGSEVRSEEDKIIETLHVEGLRRLYDDSDFLPIRQSLYNVENVIAMYDDEISQSIMWCRPQVISESPVYFTSPSQVGVLQGTLPDEIFIGALLAVCTFPKYDLLENIFSSRPDDFRNYGVFTCRFYVEGDWVEVITDTNIPCIRDDTTNTYTPVYSRSINPEEMWICLAEKAYAKAVGSYEAIQRVRIQEALMHLTGGSVQQTYLKDEDNEKHAFWNTMKDHLDSSTLVLILPNEANDDTKDTNSKDGYIVKEDLTSMAIHANNRPDHFAPNRFYSVISYKEVGDLHLLLIHSPWTVTKAYDDGNISSGDESSDVWFGHWSNSSPLWVKYPDVYDMVREGLPINWTRKSPNGYFWISIEDFRKYFGSMYACKLFPSSQYKFYCIKDEWRQKQAGGPLVTARDKAAALKDALESKKLGATKSTVVTVVDGDCAWFNNPQIRIHSSKATKIYVSCLPLSADKDGGSLAVSIDIVATKKNYGGMSSDQLHVWDSVLSDIVASDRIDGTGRVKGQEASAWGVNIDHHHNYHIIPHTMKRGQEGYFLLRIFSLEPVVVEQIPSIYYTNLTGDWHRSHDADTTGGPLTYKVDNAVQENSKWCQNPQFHLELKDLFSRDELKIKIVVRRTDTKAGGTSHYRGSFNGAGAGNDKGYHESFVGLTVCRSDCIEQNVLKNKLKKQPRLSAVGEPIPSKVSTLKKKPTGSYYGESNESDALLSSRKDTFDITKIPRKFSVMNDPHVFESTYSNRQESCIFISKISRSLIPQGLLIIPSLRDKGVKGSFEIEVYSSEPLVLKQLPDTFNKSIASEWTEQNACGSHVNPNWKKNPKFAFHFRHVSKSLTSSTRIPIRITLGRHGQSWKSLVKKDAVGCMIGFYIFIQRNNTELQQIYESLFVPGDEFSTDPSFTLTQLPVGEEYIIMPTTCSEGKIGSFVLSIMTEAEFKFHKDKS